MRKIPNAELKRKSVEEFRQAKKMPVILVLNNVRSALNVGSIFRTADAFLVEGIYLCGITAQPPNKEINKTALGATETISWKYFTNVADAIGALREEKRKIWCVEQTEMAKQLQQFQIESGEPIALIFGHEVNGVEQAAINLSDGCIEIPQSGMKHSLNVAVSVGIVLWELSKR